MAFEIALLTSFREFYQPDFGAFPIICGYRSRAKSDPTEHLNLATYN
jgi:hypothetical protein